MPTVIKMIYFYMINESSNRRTEMLRRIYESDFYEALSKAVYMMDTYKIKEHERDK